MRICPTGYAIWENIRKELGTRFKETGVENVYMLMFIPESQLQKEKDHIEGDVRPTSETLFCDFFSKIVQSRRDLLKVYNQWCAVVRWDFGTSKWAR